MRGFFRCSSVWFVSLALIAACSSSGGSQGNGTGGPTGGHGDDDGGRPSEDGGGRSGDSDGGQPRTCDAFVCELGQACELVNHKPSCVAQSCDELPCGQTQVCEAAPSGGFYCPDNSCTDDLDCVAEQHCGAQGACLVDACEPLKERCAGQVVSRCSANGRGFTPVMTCKGAGSFESKCELASGKASCSCEADWDCPEFTGCVAGRCEGTGKAAACTLPPSKFLEAIPSPEYGTRGDHWGGTNGNPTAQAGTPFAGSTQVVMTPLVANLTDDNGDGQINELDFPEIVFLTFCQSQYTKQGILRAIQGGGERKGEDLFAACGANVAWQEGGPIDDSACPCGGGAVATPADLDPTAGVAVGDLDGDGEPEIVAVTEDDKLRVYDRLGRFLTETQALGAGASGNGSPAIANIDQRGLAEIVLGRVVTTLKREVDGNGNLELAFDAVFTGSRAKGANGQGPISCLADVSSAAQGLEIIAGGSAYHLPRAPEPGELAMSVASPADCAATDVPDLADDAREVELKAYCEAALVLVWDAQDINPGTPADREGFCAVADVWGAQHGTPGMFDAPRPGPENPLDGKPEVVLITYGELQVYEGETGLLVHHESIEPAGGKYSGGAPNVDDFDGDGFPEVGTAFATAYYMIDLQATTDKCPAWPAQWPTANLGEPLSVTRPAGNLEREPPTVSCDSDDDCDATGAQFACNEQAGVCVCMHNGWKRMTQDDSSRVTGSSLFDFNGDGTVEVVYNDECFFRVYNGVDGEELSRRPSESRTRTENPVIADVDNDGNAEIVFGTSDESGFCGNTNGTFRSAADYRPGIQVWGDAADRWVSARRIYNQHAYHVTNVLEGGGIPVKEPASWLPLNGRLYNSFRSQPRSGMGIAAPNLVIGRVQLSSPNAACGKLASDDLTITVRIENGGDLRVGPGVKLGLYGEWDMPALNEALKDAIGNKLTVSLNGPLEPGAQVVLSIAYAASQNGRDALPDRVRALIDDEQSQRECIEDDNEAKVDTAEAAKALADLVAKLKSNADCANMALEVEVENLGALSVSSVPYVLYLGDPSAGGSPLAVASIAGPIAPKGSAKQTTQIPAFPQRDVTVFVVVDPQDAIPECNDGNNRASVMVKCDPGLQ